MPSQALINAAQRRKETKGRRGLKRTAPVVSEPRQIERRYQARLRKMVNDITAETRDRLIEALPSLFANRDLIAPRSDAWPEDLERIITGLRVFGRDRAEQVIEEINAIAQDTEQFNKRAFARSMAAVLGVDMTRGVDGEWLRVAMKSWAKENADLIKSIPDNLLSDVEGISQRALRTGADPRETAKEIRKRFGVSRNKAKMIGRDQVAKLNGQITKSRNEALGITTYRWSTSRDERVRASHRAMNGKLCRWDDPTVYSDDDGETWKSRSSIGGVAEHPGQDYQCFPGSTQLNATPRFNKMFRRFYSGKLCSLVLSDGVVVSATPNHPILTDRGVKPIQIINSGDYVVRHVQQAFDAIKLNGKNLIPSFREAFDAIHLLGIGRGVAAGTRSQFHGDGTDKEIDVVGLDRFLVDETYVDTLEKLKELGFTETDMVISHCLLAGFGDSLTPLIGSSNPGNGLMRRFDLVGSLIIAHTSPFERFCFALCSDVGAGPYKVPTDDVSGDLEMLGNRVFALAGLIHGDDFIRWQVNQVNAGPVMNDNIVASGLDGLTKIVGIDADDRSGVLDGHSAFVELDRVSDNVVSDFSGHIYNLETDAGYYHANKVAASNCRCVSRPVLDPVLEAL